MSEILPNRNENPEKKEILDRTRQEVNHVKDKLGEGVEDNIKEAVIGLKVFGFSTNASCEGHLDDKRLPYPWVEIYAPKPKNFNKSKGEEREKLKEEWRIENLKQQKKIIGLMDEFYQGREVPSDVKLALYKVGVFGAFRLQNFGSEGVKSLAPQEMAEKMNLYRSEMNAFSIFLQDRFLENTEEK